MPSLNQYDINCMIQHIRKGKDIRFYLVRIISHDQRIIIKERIDHWKSYFDKMKF